MTDVKMPLTAHLEELRWRLIKALLAITVGFIAAYNFADWLFDVPHPPAAWRSTRVRSQLIGTGVTEAFFTKLKVSFIAALFLASPVLFYQAWMFVAPGLYDTGEALRAAVRRSSPRSSSSPARRSATASSSRSAIAFFIEEYQTIGVSP